MRKKTIEAICYGIAAALASFIFGLFCYWVSIGGYHERWVEGLAFTGCAYAVVAPVFGCYVTAKMMEE